MDVGTRIGPSTLIVESGSAHAIISIVGSINAAGFKTIEICPLQAKSVDPSMNPALIDDLFNEAERRTLRQHFARSTLSPSTPPHTGLLPFEVKRWMTHSVRPTAS